MDNSDTTKEFFEPSTKIALFIGALSLCGVLYFDKDETKEITPPVTLGDGSPPSDIQGINYLDKIVEGPCSLTIKAQDKFGNTLTADQYDVENDIPQDSPQNITDITVSGCTDNSYSDTAMRCTSDELLHAAQNADTSYAIAMSIILDQSFTFDTPSTECVFIDSEGNDITDTHAKHNHLSM